MTRMPDGLLTADRIVIVGGPMAGKSTLARQLRAEGYTTFCSDPRSTVRHPEPDVTYLPEHLEWGSVSTHIADYWLTRPGRWVIEGHATARALRKQLHTTGRVTVDRVLVLPRAHPCAYLAEAQRPLATSVMRVWNEIEAQLRDMTDVITFDIGDQAPAWSPMDAINALATQASQLRS